jgi:ParB family chromosome partitioning protein
MGKKSDADLWSSGGEDEPLAGALMVSIGQIRASTTHPRRWLAQGALDSLAASIRDRGILQPLRARPDAAAPGRYILVVGERRLRAAAQAGLTAVPVIVCALSPDQALLDALAENVARVDLADGDLVEAYRLLRERGLSDRRIAAAIGVAHTTIGRLLRVADDELLCETVETGLLTMFLAWDLLPLDDDTRAIVIRFLAARQGEDARVGRDELRGLIEAARPLPPPSPGAADGADAPVGTVSPPMPSADADAGEDGAGDDGAGPGACFAGATTEQAAMAEARAAGRARALRRYAEGQLALLRPFVRRGLVEEDLRAILGLLLELYPELPAGFLERA